MSTASQPPSFYGNTEGQEVDLVEAIRWILENAHDNPEAASLLHELADKLEAMGQQDRGGTGDRVRAVVSGPDGTVKQIVDTGA